MMLTESYKYGFSVLGGAPPGNPNPGTIKFGQESSHTFLFGVRYVLFPAAVMAPAPTPAPAPTASPAAPPAKTYLVFFDWDKSSLTPRATEIIAEAASDSKSTAVTTIDVSGYTDTSGTPVYNQGLSERRAQAVAAQLVTDGVPAGEIETHAYGETHLLVPTGPGVREPQNRRVEIVLQ
jgi:outer membrane protein OmpA-like peptidoglycan-associated protein